MLFFSTTTTAAAAAIAAPSHYANAPPIKPDAALHPRPNTHPGISWEFLSSKSLPPDSTRPSTPPPCHHASCAGEEEDLDTVEFMIDEVVYSRDIEPLQVNYSSLLSSPALCPSSSSSSETYSSSSSLASSSHFDIDAEAFPPYAHLFPSSPNGIWRNEVLHALKHPHTIDPAGLAEELLGLAEDAAGEFSAKLNTMCEGKDVPAMHGRVVGYLPKLKVPDWRELERVVERWWEAGVEVWIGMRGRDVGEEMDEWVDLGGEWEVNAVMGKKSE